MQDRKPYPPSSLYNIVAAIQRFLREKGRPDISFFDVKAPEFANHLMPGRKNLLLQGLVL